MDEQSILDRIGEFVEEEHRLRDAVQSGEMTSDEERARLTRLEQALDQCWDLLRQRRARREFGLNPDEATVRDATTVERYEA